MRVVKNTHGPLVFCHCASHVGCRKHAERCLECDLWRKAEWELKRTALERVASRILRAASKGEMRSWDDAVLSLRVAEKVAK